MAASRVVSGGGSRTPIRARQPFCPLKLVERLSAHRRTQSEQSPSGSATGRLFIASPNALISLAPTMCLSGDNFYEKRTLGCVPGRSKKSGGSSRQLFLSSRTQNVDQFAPSMSSILTMRLLPWSAM